MPGESDRFRFSAKRGQNLTIEAQARHLIPYLADAVPGWFQVTLALYDGKGKEVAYADNYRFNPDPVLFYRITEDGDYEIEVRDAIYRGREDFVYRVSISEKPFITQIFPLGGQGRGPQRSPRYGAGTSTSTSFRWIPARRQPDTTDTITQTILQ